MSDINQGGPTARAVLAVPEPCAASFGFRAWFWSKALRGYGRSRHADLHTNVHIVFQNHHAVHLDGVQ